MGNKIKNRDIGIDLVKVLAIIGVIIIHLCDYEAKVGTSDWTWSVFWGSITRSSVPLFLMASGAVMLNPDKEIPVKKLYLKNILRILVAMFVWGVFYKVYHLFEYDALTPELFFHSIREVLLFDQEFHFYYMHIILIVYMFLPITRIIIKNATEKQLRYLLLLWFIFAIVYPTVQPYWLFGELRGMVPQWGINLTYASIGYGILGYYLKKYSIPKGMDIICTILGFLFIFIGTYVVSVMKGELYQRFLEGISIGVALLGFGIFSLANKVKIKSEIIKNIINWLSKASFCVYLCHMLIIYFLKRIGINIGFAFYGISIPLLSIMIFILSNAVYAILSHIPIVKKWII